jgi:hypothetical protein
MSSWLGSAVEQQLLPLIRDGIEPSLFSLLPYLCFLPTVHIFILLHISLIVIIQVSAQLSMASGR